MGFQTQRQDSAEARIIKDLKEVILKAKNEYGIIIDDISPEWIDSNVSEHLINVKVFIRGSRS